MRHQRYGILVKPTTVTRFFAVEAMENVNPQNPYDLSRIAGLCLAGYADCEHADPGRVLERTGYRCVPGVTGRYFSLCRHSWQVICTWPRCR